MFAIIGGSGLAKFSALTNTRRQVARTPYGEPSGALTFGSLGGHDVVFLARHGYGHTIAPHEINYRANIWALKELGVSGIYAVASVGGIRDDLTPGTLVVPDQIIDYTHGRKSTFSGGTDFPISHIDFTKPYARAMRHRILEGAQRCGQPVVDGAVYACTQGPRLETAAEINRIARDGGDIVGMTGMPEACLAREAELEYATLAVVVNHAAGRGDSQELVALDTLESVLAEAIKRAVCVIEAALSVDN